MLKVSAPHVPTTHLSQTSTSLGHLFRQRAELTPDREAFFEKGPTGFAPTTWKQAFARASVYAAGLASLSLGRGDRLAIVGPTQLRYALFDFSAHLLGLLSFGIYQQQTVEQIRYLLSHSEAKVVVVGDEKELPNLVAAARDLPSLCAIVPWDEEVFLRHQALDPRMRSPNSLFHKPLSSEEIKASLAAILPDDPAVLIYTSGTTGPPKAAMLSHRNIFAMFQGAQHFTDFFADDITISFLPMAHAAERVLSNYGRLSCGVATAFASSMGNLLSELREVAPTVFGSVPRIFEKAYARILSEIEQKPYPVRRLFAWARRVSLLHMRKVHCGEPVQPLLALQHRFVDALLWRKIRAVFGGRVRYFVVGAAATPPDVLEFFWACGLPLIEVYGMTEATAITHVNTRKVFRLGTVGKLIAGMEQRIAPDGEILVRGDSVFLGYYKDPAATASALVDGWLHTGDVGVLDADGFLRITDRKKHLIITAGGKNLSPGNIEAAIKGSDPLVSHIIAHGDGRAFVSAIVAPSPLETLEWGQRHGLLSAEVVSARTAELLHNPAGRSVALEEAMALVVAHPDFTTRILKAVRVGNAKLAHVEQVRKVWILPRDLSQEHGEMTPTMKVRRREIERKYAAELQRLYDENNFGLSV